MSNEGLWARIDALSARVPDDAWGGFAPRLGGESRRIHVGLHSDEAIFVDTAFWIARIYPRDNLHQIARQWGDACVNHPLVTTDAVLTELGAFFAERGPKLRQLVAEYIAELENNPNLTLLPDTREVVKKARQLYADRPDKGYSPVDCNSMVVRRERGIRMVLTSDEHFEQEGFVALMRRDVSDAELFL